MSNTAVAKFNMIQQQIRPWEVLDNQVLSVFDEVNREDFVPEPYKGLAYADCQIPLGNGASMLPPTVEGRMLQALTVRPQDLALEIGCACGFVTACLAQLAQRVTSIDTRGEIIALARENIAARELDNVDLQQKAVDQIEDENAWDVITVTASMAAVPQNLRQALSVGGRLFIVVGESPVMEALLITRVGETEWTTRSLFETDLPRLDG